jgi:predicted nucleic acid-binding protein
LPERVIFDTCTLQNFAVVDRLDLLESRYGYRSAWTLTVRTEIKNGLPKVPALQKVLDASWLGEPIEVVTDSSSVAVLQAINNNRRALSAVPSKMTSSEHMGEAEIIYLMAKAPADWLFITDDQPAKDLAHKRGLKAKDTVDVLLECNEMSDINCPDAYQLLERMADHDRGVRLPEDHRLVCPIVWPRH